ncbi:hypothetical protein W823_05020 [Williamsia sp. D3]|nr:hypothetical protein W823_05020 [Williamsia sp. D3]
MQFKWESVGKIPNNDRAVPLITEATPPDLRGLHASFLT